MDFIILDFCHKYPLLLTFRRRMRVMTRMSEGAGDGAMDVVGLYVRHQQKYNMPGAKCFGKI